MEETLVHISIHALRVEGDPRLGLRGGAPRISIHALRVEGDLGNVLNGFFALVFLSTPSGWRATRVWDCVAVHRAFLSTPSGWRATAENMYRYSKLLFLSTPSGWRATSRDTPTVRDR